MFDAGEILLCVSDSLLSTALYLFTLIGSDFCCHAHIMVTVVLVTLTILRLTASIRAVEIK